MLSCTEKSHTSSMHEGDSRICSVSVGLRSQAIARSHNTGDYPAVVWATVGLKPPGPLKNRARGGTSNQRMKEEHARPLDF
jgi:hypothetical protein